MQKTMTKRRTGGRPRPSDIKMRKAAAPQGRGPAAGRAGRTGSQRAGLDTGVGTVTLEDTQRMLDEREQQELIEEE
jgi:hypothetical protein